MHGKLHGKHIQPSVAWVSPWQNFRKDAPQGGMDKSSCPSAKLEVAAFSVSFFFFLGLVLFCVFFCSFFFCGGAQFLHTCAHTYPNIYTTHTTGLTHSSHGALNFCTHAHTPTHLNKYAIHHHHRSPPLTSHGYVHLQARPLFPPSSSSSYAFGSCPSSSSSSFFFLYP